MYVATADDVALQVVKLMHRQLACDYSPSKLHIYGLLHALSNLFQDSWCSRTTIPSRPLSGHFSAGVSVIGCLVVLQHFESELCVI
jgi:hypothetical protein